MINFHDLHNDYPLAVERLQVGKVDKLVPNLRIKQKYVIHHAVLKQCGLKITQIHCGIKFEESGVKVDIFLYIDLSTEQRAKAKNEFKTDLR